MLVLILIDVQYSQKVVYSLEKGLIHQNRSSGSFHPLIPCPSKISDSPQWEESPHPLLLLGKPCGVLDGMTSQE